MSHTLPTLSSMRVADVDKEFAHWGVSPPTGWNVAEKKSYLKELRTASGVVSDLGLTRNLPKVKGDLIEYCRTKGLRLTGNETVAQLTRKLKERESDLAPVLGTEIIGFGKHKNLPFLEIYETDRPYCQWAVTTVLESTTTHPQMRRFAKYCDLMQEAERSGLLDPEEPELDVTNRQTRFRAGKGGDKGKNAKRAPSLSKVRPRPSPESSSGADASFSSPMESELDPSHEGELQNLAAQVLRVSQGNPLVADRLRQLLDPTTPGATSSAATPPPSSQ